MLALVVLPEIKVIMVAMEYQMLKAVAVAVVHTIIEVEWVVLLVVRVVPGGAVLLTRLPASGLEGAQGGAPGAPGH